MVRHLISRMIHALEAASDRREHKIRVLVAAGRVVATSEGIAALGRDYAALPTGDALREVVLARLPEGERKVLQVLIDAYPSAVARDMLEDQTVNRPARE